MESGLYLYSAYLVLMTTQSSLPYSCMPFTHSHTFIQWQHFKKQQINDYFKPNSH